MIFSHIAIIHVESVPVELFSDFKESVSEEGLNLQIESRQSDVAFAAIEWLIPTAVIVYISKSYFDGFLNEMGKDHYVSLKIGLNKLRHKFFGASAPNTILIGPKGKVAKDQPYSLIFSIMAEAEPGLKFKLMIQKDVTAEEYEHILNAYLDFLDAFHSHSLSQEMVDMLKTSNVIGGTLLLAHNRATGIIEPVNPLSKKVLDESTTK